MKIRLKKTSGFWKKAAISSLIFTMFFTLMMSETVFAAGLNKDQKRRAEQLTSIFENGKTEIQYGYVEALDDGRGYTCGRAGFTTATGDALEVVEVYTKAVPNNKLKKYLPELRRLAKEESDDISNLKGFDSAWSSLGNDKDFRAAQDAVNDRLYYQPAMKRSDNAGLKTGLARAVMYDTVIQHGDGDDPDSFYSLIKRTNKKAGGSPKDGIDEKKWLNKFLDVRYDDLMNPADPDTRDVWRESVARVDVFRSIAKSNNYNLNGPIHVHSKEYGNFVIK
ncbi:chitosanase [Bacillus glycinifermentans]|uniref:Chitosanase n=1 Tax=Bacillus glycinifermentans TaxID=1664069 RepID=A0A0J6EXW6_9BACI|nr:chitosanase [Bacillus glycinifermentans]ATH92523.1 chitosanase [Bacillus glycinifermentans]KMM59957.1 chitosanase [Bacillus glycinifermentans]KRT95270.1 chitosanase [Bacillus glycinifermentans]MEC0485073.1 chitosanase [Bacillus glycinifermentans]MEC0493261.1 chitosanase [Bacillus glycinifermentans]